MCIQNPMGDTVMSGPDADKLESVIDRLSLLQGRGGMNFRESEMRVSNLESTTQRVEVDLGRETAEVESKFISLLRPVDARFRGAEDLFLDNKRDLEVQISKVHRVFLENIAEERSHKEEKERDAQKEQNRGGAESKRSPIRHSDASREVKKWNPSAETFYPRKERLDIGDTDEGTDEPDEPVEPLPEGITRSYFFHPDNIFPYPIKKSQDFDREERNATWENGSDFSSKTASWVLTDTRDPQNDYMRVYPFGKTIKTQSGGWPYWPSEREDKLNLNIKKEDIGGTLSGIGDWRSFLRIIDDEISLKLRGQVLSFTQGRKLVRSLLINLFSSDGRSKMVCITPPPRSPRGGPRGTKKGVKQKIAVRDISARYRAIVWKGFA